MSHSSDFVPPVRDDLVGEVAYGAPQAEVRARLNVNENPFPLPDSLAQAIAAAVRDVVPTLNRYPDRDASSLREALATYLAAESGVHVSSDQVWVANGSNEVMHHLFLAFGGPGRSGLTCTPTYSMYPEYARDTFTTWVEVPRKDDFTIDMERTLSVISEVRPTLVVLASPNNPTGTPLPLEQLKVIAESLGHGVLVVDEAYAEFRAQGKPSAMELFADHPNVVVTRTMSKAFSCAGLRVGYLAAASAHVVDALRVVRLPYHLSAVTQAVAQTALAHASILQAQVAVLRDERDALATWLRAQGLEVAESDANFLLFGRFRDRHALWQDLFDQGVLIRETGPDGWLRVTVGSPQENGMFRDALTHALQREAEAQHPRMIDQ